MLAEFKKSNLNGIIDAPPSKSMAHRYLICAALSKETSVLENVDLSEDIKATINCLKVLGAKIEINGNSIKICGMNCGKDNLKRDANVDNIILNANESGSTLRFLIPYAMLLGKDIIFEGSTTLMNRPQSVYEKIAQENKINFKKINEKQLLVNGTLNGGIFNVDGNISSQFITGLLFILPLLKEDSKIYIKEPFESKSYVLMTIDVMKKFGVEVNLNGNTINIKGMQSYKGINATIEGDYSNAAFLDVYNYIGGDVKVNGLILDSLQGDKIYKKYFKEISSGKIIDISNCPDLGPILFALAALKGGASFTGTKRLAIKESNRALAMKEELIKFGIEVEVFENDVIVKNGVIKIPKEILLSHNDHRIVMAISTILTVTGGKIKDIEAVNKSFPNYFDKIKMLGAKVSLED